MLFLCALHNDVKILVYNVVCRFQKPELRSAISMVGLYNNNYASAAANRMPSGGFRREPSNSGGFKSRMLSLRASSTSSKRGSMATAGSTSALLNKSAATSPKVASIDIRSDSKDEMA